MKCLSLLVRSPKSIAAALALAGLCANLTAQRANSQTADEPPAAFAGGRMVRGTVSAIAGDHLSVKTEAGDVYQVAITPNTQIRKGRDPMKFAAIHVGDGVGAMGELDAPKKTVHALMLMIIDAEQLKKARENLGKTFITGKITAIDELKLTVLRSDNVTQVIQVDEDTSFKRGGRSMQAFTGNGGPQAIAPQRPDRPDGTGGGGSGRPGTERRATGGESITLADVKVGDIVAGQGALKSGVFVPTELHVMDAARRRPRPEAAASGPAGTGPK